MKSIFGAVILMAINSTVQAQGMTDIEIVRSGPSPSIRGGCRD
jgi:hypothetical protein